MLLALGIAIFILPPIGGIENQSASNGNAKIGLNETLKHEMFGDAKIHGILSDVKVSASGTLRVIKKSKKSKYKKVTYKKVKAAYKYRVKVRYYYKGKWRTKWVYRYYTSAKQTVSASSSTSSVGTSVGAYNVVVTSEYVYATGRCSCSLYTDYNYHTRVFENFNPATCHFGVLKFEQGPAPKTSPEGLWVATDTDMDFCLVHGKSHDNRNVFLVPYNGVINGINVVNGYFTDAVVNPVTNNNQTDSTNNSSTTDNTNSTNGTDANK